MLSPFLTFRRVLHGAAILSLCLPLRAELPFAKLATIYPAGGRAGTTVEVRVTGADLDDAHAILFSQPGITASPKDPAEIDPRVFLVTIASNAAPGLVEARVLTRFGASNPRRFSIGQWEEILEYGAAGSLEMAQPVTIGSTLNGRARAAGWGYFKFKARKGDRVLIECAAKSIESRMEPILVLSSASGRELARERHTGLLDYTAREDAEFILKVADLLYRGGEEYFYRLTVSLAPHLDAILPKAGKAGTTGEFTLYGRNLPGGMPAPELSKAGLPLEKVRVQITLPERADELKTSELNLPAASSIDGFEYRFKGTNGISNPVFIGFTPDPVVLEPKSEAQLAEPPFEMDGQLFPAGDVDAVRFQAKKGSVYSIEAFAHREGLPMAPFVLLQQVKRDAAGKEVLSDIKEIYGTEANLGGPDFNTAARDPYWRFEAKEDLLCQLQIKDLFHPLESSPELGYRLAVRPESPDFRLLAVPLAPPPQNKDKKEAALWHPLLRRGETIPVRVILFRKENFAGDVEVKVENPPAGVSASPAVIRAGTTSAFLLLTAATNASRWCGPLRITGEAKIGDKQVTHPARAGILSWQVEDYTKEPPNPRLTQDFVLSVSDQELAPIRFVSPTNAPIESKDGKFRIPIKFARGEGFQGAVKFKLVSAAGEGKETDVDGKGTEAALEGESGPLKLTPGDNLVRAVAVTSGSYKKYSGEEGKALEQKMKETAEAVKKLEAQKKEAGAAQAKAAESAKAAAKAAEEARGQTASNADASGQPKLAAALEKARQSEEAAKTAAHNLKKVEEDLAQAQQRSKALAEKNQARTVTYTASSGAFLVHLNSGK